MKKRLTLIVGILGLFTLFYSCKSSMGFVKVKETHFTVKHKPYYYVGTNFWYGAYLGADSEYGDRARLLRELDRLKNIGVKNLRVVAASEESDFSLPLSPPFQYRDGHYNEKLLEGLDFLLSEMGKRNMRAVLVLNNYWDWSGGMSEYVSWATGEAVVDPTADKNVGWSDFLDFSARFYQLKKAQKRYRKYIDMLVNRKNVYTKKEYKNDPAIMTWELANEPRPAKKGDPQENVKIFSKWVDETAGFIHSIDKKHLVTTGSEGEKGTLNSWDFTREAHAIKSIDYLTIHMWPKNWGWYKADAPSTLGTAKENTIDYIGKGLKTARKLNKPMVIEEFGFMRDGEKAAADSPANDRNNYYRFLFRLAQDSIQAGSPLAGTNFWGWGGEGRAQHADHQWQVGDSVYLGDPYSEAQGLNSIYDTDKETLEIITKSAKELNNLSPIPKKK